MVMILTYDDVDGGVERGQCLRIIVSAQVGVPLLGES